MAITFLKVINIPIYVSGNLYFTGSFNLINFRFQLFLLFFPEMSNSFASYIDEIIYIVLVWMLYPLHFSLLPSI